MPVDLSTVPAAIPLPKRPSAKRWAFVVALCWLLGSGLLLLLWPGELVQQSLWFWCCVLMAPALAGLLLVVGRGLLYERQRDIAHSWNTLREEHHASLVEEGQTALAVLATSYCTAAGRNQLALALRSGSKPLQPVYLGHHDGSPNLSRLPDLEDDGAAADLQARLQQHLGQVARGLAQEARMYAPLAPIALRIKHNQLLDDQTILSVWQACAAGYPAIEQVRFASNEDGLMWLDDWLDQPDAVPIMLSVEINLSQEPLPGQAESVSALLLAHPQFCETHRVQPKAWLHRPVAMSAAPESLEQVLRWGCLPEGETLFSWQAQVPDALLASLRMLLAQAGQWVEGDHCLMLDGALGRPACAVGNLMMIIGSEQVATEGRPQLMMLQDVSAHWLVIRPAGGVAP